MCFSCVQLCRSGCRNVLFSTADNMVEVLIHLVVMVTRPKKTTTKNHQLSVNQLNTSIILSLFSLSPTWLRCIQTLQKMALPLQKSPFFPQHTAYYFVGHCHADLVGYTSYQRSPRLPCPVFISATIQSSLYIRHHNNHKCSDRFAGTAVRGEASERESESEHERKRETQRERERHPPTQNHW